MTYDESTLVQLSEDAQQIISRYPVERSALLPLLHLVQSVDGFVSPDGIDFCAEQLDLTAAEVSAVATFYTQYKRRPNGEYQVGVCTNTLCAVMGGDRIWDELSSHCGLGNGETTQDGSITLERIECNAACDYAPVMMVNWEFFDNQTPESAKQVVDALRAGKDVTPTRGPNKVQTFKQVERVLAGFEDGLANEDQGAGVPTLAGLEAARAAGWSGPGGKPAGKSASKSASKSAATSAAKSAGKPAGKSGAGAKAAPANAAPANAAPANAALANAAPANAAPANAAPANAAPSKTAASKNTGSKDPASKNTASKDPASKNTASKDPASKDPASKDTASGSNASKGGAK